MHKDSKTSSDNTYTSSSTSYKECVTLSGYGDYTVYTKVTDAAGNLQSTTPQNKNSYYYQNYTLKAATKKMYFCRDGYTNIHIYKSTSCSDSKAFNCSYQVYSSIDSPKSVEVKSTIDNHFYVLVTPYKKKFNNVTYTFKYIHEDCLSSSSRPSDCKSKCSG